MTDELQKKGPQSLERPSFLPKGDHRGTEHMTKDDLKIPRLGLAQGLSDEIKPEHAKYIEGLTQGQFFNDVKKEVLGKGPIFFYIVRGDKPRGVEFNPREAGGGVKDLNVPLDDPRMQFGPNGEKPVGTKFYDYVIVMEPVNKTNPMESVIALSFKGSGLKTARELNSLIMLRDAPLFSGRYSATTTNERNAKGAWYGLNIKNAGWVQDEETYKALESMFTGLKGKEITFEREPGSDDEAQPVEAGSGAGAVPDKEIPF